MYKSYFTIGWRNLLKSKGYSLININGLALGMVVVVMIGLWVRDELTFNTYHKNHERLAQVGNHVSIGGETLTYFSLPLPVADELRSIYKDDFDAVAAAGFFDRIVSHEEKALTRRGCFADYAFPEIVSLSMQSGQYDSFKDRSSIFLSESFAEALFGTIDPINKYIRIGNSDLLVTGIYEDLPRNSTFYEMYFIAPVEVLLSNRAAMDNWQSSSFQIYVLLNANTDFEAAASKIRDLVFNHTQEVTHPQLSLFPMDKWHLYEFRDGQSVPGRFKLVYAVGIIGFFILALACINFVNLSTARSEKRSREIGVRKTLGSVKSQLISQFLCESFLICLLALLLAITAVVLLLPTFNEFSNKDIELPLANPLFWLVLFLATIFIGFAAGGYPAFYLSAFNPVRSLKGVNTGQASSNARKTLVVVQFGISVILIVCTLVVYNQIQFVKDRTTGYSRNGLISVPLMTREIMEKYNTLRLELLKTDGIENVSRSSSPTTDIYASADNLDWVGKDPNQQVLFGTICIDPYFDEVISWKIKSGRNFSSEIASDTSGFIFNEAAIRQMNLTDPIGETVTWHGKNWNIIGVVHDMVMTSPFEAAMPTVFMIDNRERPFNIMNIRLSKNISTSDALIELERAFKKMVPNTPFDYRFADQEYSAKFAAEESIGKLVFTFTAVAIIISCMGLLGLTSFVVEQRTKEIGIRKVLGASASEIWKLVSYEFFPLVAVACVLAIPVSWFLMSGWLQQYEYRMKLGGDLFAISAGVAFLITLITVSYHAFNATLMNPVKSLKSE